MADLEETAERWTSDQRTVNICPPNPSPLLLDTAEALFATQLLPTTEHRDFLRLATPIPANPKGQQLRRNYLGAAEFRIRSPDTNDPDGIILARDESSRLLVSEGAISTRRRITRSGIAEVLDITSPQLVQLPLPSYRDAVAAPFVNVGFAVTPSDKGRYQQRTLGLARGLLFLTWVLRQPESAQLLELFFSYHLASGNPPPDYRRAVEYPELRKKLHEQLRTRRKRLRTTLVERAETWLRAWGDSLLERGLLVAGYVLACQECSERAWYSTEHVGQTFRCVRCHHQASVISTARLSFRLNEAFYQFVLHHGDVVTLTLAILRSEAEESFLYLPETTLDDGTRSREIDAAALVDGRLVLVEAKSSDGLTQAEVAWYRYLAIKTRAAALLFATKAERWNETTENRLTILGGELAPKGIAVRSVARDDLLSGNGGELEIFVRRPSPPPV
jgi:hypothetical protein